MSAAAATAARQDSPAPSVSAEEAGRRVEEVLEHLAATGDREVCAAAEELVRTLMDFYGAGLARILELLERPAQPAGAAPLERLLRDELVSGLLVLHDLHPEDLPTRIGRALDSLPGRPVETVGFDPDTGTLRVRSTDPGGCGCPSTNDAARQSVEQALACFVTEVTAVELEQPGGGKESPLLQIQLRPGLARASAEAP